MKNAFLLHHLGLGDHIICNGLVRHLAEEYDTLIFPTKKHNLINVNAMFSDLENISIMPVEDDVGMLKEWEKYRSIFSAIKLGCFEKPNFIKPGETFCRAFYRQANVPSEFRWEKFFVPRNIVREKKLLDSVTSDKYYFVHDDESRGLNISQDYLIGNFYRPKHVLGDKTETTIFDYRKVIEQSTQIHCMDSSFAAFIDHLPELFNKQKTIHRYIRKSSANPEYKNNWAIVNE